MTSAAQPAYRQRLGYHAGLLGGICFLVSVLLIIGNLETSDRIAAHIEAEKRAMLAEVLPASLYDNAPLASPAVQAVSAPFSAPLTIYTATLDGRYNGAALQSAIYGWGSDIQFIVAVDGTGTITGVRVISHGETPGLADGIDIARDPWITGFNGKSLDNPDKRGWGVKKDGGQFDQFTGATITPRAMVRGVHASLQALDAWRQQQLAATATAADSQED
ncbi:RnfABCDGE type electron transport complex subunit G [Mangrovimicrobium sediminis]|nr:RnfABCDGE type electron transport complex subunit G [Haliea sp. SAOS-164]